MEFLEVYAEYGAIGVVVVLFIWGFIGQNKRVDAQAIELGKLQVENAEQTTKITNIESIVLKMLDRWNKSDDKADRRHEQSIRELNDLSDVMMEVKGNVARIDGK